MLTKSERRFIEDPGQFSRERQRLYRCRINKKIRKFSSDIRMILEQNSRLGIDLGPLQDFLHYTPFQNSETPQDTGGGPARTGNPLLDSLEGW